MGLGGVEEEMVCFEYGSKQLQLACSWHCREGSRDRERRVQVFQKKKKKKKRERNSIGFVCTSHTGVFMSHAIATKGGSLGDKSAFG